MSVGDLVKTEFDEGSVAVEQGDQCVICGQFFDRQQLTEHWRAEHVEFSEDLMAAGFKGEVDEPPPELGTGCEVKDEPIEELTRLKREGEFDAPVAGSAPVTNSGDIASAGTKLVAGKMPTRSKLEEIMSRYCKDSDGVIKAKKATDKLNLSYNYKAGSPSQKDYSSEPLSKRPRVDTPLRLAIPKPLAMTDEALRGYVCRIPKCTAVFTTEMYRAIHEQNPHKGGDFVQNNNIHRVSRPVTKAVGNTLTRNGGKMCIQGDRPVRRPARETKTNIFKCRYDGCHYETNRPGYIKIHEATHEDEKLFRCRFCDRDFKQMHQLYAHETKAHYAQKMLYEQQQAAEQVSDH